MVSLRQKLRKDVLPLHERVFHLAAHEEYVGDCAKKSEADFVCDHVADEGSDDAVAGFRAEFMAVMPTLERPLGLHIGEGMVPFELGDSRDPLRPHRQKREDGERGDYGGTDARRQVRRYASGWRRRRHTVERENLRAASCRHDARQVLRVREEGEHALDGEGYPLLELEMIRHVWRLSS